MSTYLYIVIGLAIFAAGLVAAIYSARFCYKSKKYDLSKVCFMTSVFAVLCIAVLSRNSGLGLPVHESVSKFNQGQYYVRVAGPIDGRADGFNFFLIQAMYESHEAVTFSKPVLYKLPEDKIVPECFVVVEYPDEYRWEQNKVCQNMLDEASK